MTKKQMIRRVVWWMATVAIACVPFAADAAYPEKPIKMIVPWAAGGDTDIISRVFGNAIESSSDSLWWP